MKFILALLMFSSFTHASSLKTRIEWLDGTMIYNTAIDASFVGTLKESCLGTFIRHVEYMNQTEAYFELIKDVRDMNVAIKSVRFTLRIQGTKEDLANCSVALSGEVAATDANNMVIHKNSRNAQTRPSSFLVRGPDEYIIDKNVRYLTPSTLLKEMREQMEMEQNIWD